MTSYVVLQHNDEPAAKSLEKTVFVRDAFSIVALAFPILWLFWHRLWIAGTSAFALFITVNLVAGGNAEQFWLVMVFNIFLSLLVAFEGPALRMGVLRFSGFKDRAIIDADNLEQAQLRWALGHLKTEPAPVQQTPSVAQTNYQDDLIFSTSGQS